MREGTDVSSVELSNIELRRRMRERGVTVSALARASKMSESEVRRSAMLVWNVRK